MPEIRDNLADRIVNYIDPVRGVRRRRARMILALTGGYEGASTSRRGLSKYNPPGGSADADINYDLPKLRERSRDLVRNNGLAAGAINTTVTNVVGTGLRLNARIDRKSLGMTEDEAEEFQARAERGFRVWSMECDIERQLKFYEMQDLVFRSTLESGDCIVILPYLKRSGEAFGLKLQVIEGDRLSNPNYKTDTKTLSGGVKLDGEGAPVGYYILTQHPGDYGKGLTREWRYYSAYTKTGRRSVLHLFRKLRSGQHRGIPHLSPVIELLKQLDRYTEAEIMAAVISGMFTVFVKSESGEGLSPMEPTDDIGGSTSDEDYKLDYGAIIEMNPGDDISMANPGRPNSAFDPFVTAIIRQIGVALEIPYEVLVKHFTSSYSAARAAMLDAWRFFKSRRSWLVHQFCEPVYEAWMTEAVARGYLYAPGFLNDPILRQAYLGAEWIGPSQGQIDPVKEVSAAEKRLKLKLTTRSEECVAITGTDWEQKVPQIKREEEMVGAVESEEIRGENGGEENRDDEDGGGREAGTEPEE